MSKILVKVTIDSSQGGGKTLTLDFLQNLFTAYGLTVSAKVDEEHQTSFFVQGQAHQLAMPELQSAPFPDVDRRDHSTRPGEGLLKAVFEHKPFEHQKFRASDVFNNLAQPVDFERKPTRFSGLTPPTLHGLAENFVVDVKKPSLGTSATLHRAPSKFDHLLKVCAAECPGCQFCDGALKYCEVCHGGEGDLPTECPGRSMVDIEMMDISAGKLDFIGGKWVGVGGKARE